MPRTRIWLRTAALCALGFLAVADCAPRSSALDGMRPSMTVDTPPPDLVTTGAADLAVTPDAARAGFRDWAAYPAIVQLDTAADLYALGDVHGDYDRLVALLVKHRLVDKPPARPELGQWAAGGAVLVVTGDAIDKWSQALPVLTLLQGLETSAAAAGGRVIVTAGNHEAEFLADPTASKVEDFAAELQKAGISPTEVAAGRHPLGQYLRARPIAARVRDWFFSHAGNTAGQTLPELTRTIEEGMNRDGFAADVLLADDSILEARVEPTPWWELAGDPEATLRQRAKALGVAHLVIGHQPGKYGFADGSVRAKGKVFALYGVLFFNDVGMSRGVDYSQGALLKIETRAGKTTASALYADGSRAVVFTE